MTPQELATRQSLEIVNATIRDLCLRRDQIAASLAIPVNPVMDDTGVAFLTGGVSAVRELNKRRAAAGRSEAARLRKAAKLAGITTK